MSDHYVIARFWAKVDVRRPTACWPWGGFRNDAGYGQFWDGQRLVRSHRFAYELVHGLAEGDVDHTCHNGSGCPGGRTCAHRACCNPAHLEDVTHRENVRRGQAGTRSTGWRTACVKGHPYDDANTYIDPNGHQRCRTCNRDRVATRRK